MGRKKTIYVIIAIVVLVIIFIIYFLFSQCNFAENFLSNYETYTKTELLNKPLKSVLDTENSVRVPILVYHSVLPYYPSESTYRKKYDVEPKVFEEQLKYLKDNNYSSVSLDDLANYFSNNKPLPSKPVVLTFDDGWENQYIYALPLLKKYNYTATFFVYTNSIGHRLFLTWSQLKEMVGFGMLIGDHTKTHPYLFKITDQKELRKEILDSRDILEKNLDVKIDIFAYPFGRYNDEILSILKENGFRVARTDGYKGILHSEKELFKLRSIDATNDMDQFVENININK